MINNKDGLKLYYLSTEYVYHENSNGFKKPIKTRNNLTILMLKCKDLLQQNAGIELHHEEPIMNQVADTMAKMATTKPELLSHIYILLSPLIK